MTRHPRPTIKSTKKNRNRNNNRASSTAIDVAECIDGDIESMAGRPILMATGTLILTDDDARTVRSDHALMPQDLLRCLCCAAECNDDIRSPTVFSKADSPNCVARRCVVYKSKWRVLHSAYSTLRTDANSTGLHRRATTHKITRHFSKMSQPVNHDISHC